MKHICIISLKLLNVVLALYIINIIFYIRVWRLLHELNGMYTIHSYDVLLFLVTFFRRAFTTLIKKKKSVYYSVIVVQTVQIRLLFARCQFILLLIFFFYLRFRFLVVTLILPDATIGPETCAMDTTVYLPTRVIARRLIYVNT